MQTRKYTFPNRPISIEINLITRRAFFQLPGIDRSSRSYHLTPASYQRLLGCIGTHYYKNLRLSAITPGVLFTEIYRANS